MTRLNEVFDAVRASEALKTQTAQAVVREMRAGGARRRGRRLLPALAVAVCLLVAAGLGGHALYYTPTTVLSIDINPSLEMDINRFDRVIALNGYNDDGAALAAALDVQNWRYDEAVDALLANATIADCLARGEELAIAVVQAQDDAAQSGAVLDYVSGCMGRHENAHCYALEAGGGARGGAFLRQVPRLSGTSGLRPEPDGGGGAADDDARAARSAGPVPGRGGD